MKQRLAVCLLILGVSTLGLFLLARHRQPSAQPARLPVPVSLSSTSGPVVKAATATPLAVTPQHPLAHGINTSNANNTNITTLPPQALAATAAIENFAKWAEEFSRSSANVVEGQRLAWKRREAMLELIQTDPAQALALAAPFSWRQQLPPQVTRFFEQQLDGRGDYNVAVGTDFTTASTATYRSVQLGGTNYQAFVYGRRLAQSCQTWIPLHGIALDGKMAVSSEPLRKLTPDEAAALSRQRGQVLDEICGVSGNSVTSRNQPVYAESGGGVCCFCGVDHYNFVSKQWILAESGTASAGETPPTGGVGGPVNDAWTHGTKTLLFMRVNFPDDLTEPVSEGGAYSVMNSVNDYFTMVSYDLASLDTTVAPLVTLPQTKAYYSSVGPGALLTDARAATKAAGYDTANYDRDIVAFTSVPGYNFGGLAYVGGKGVWLQSVGAGVAAHELGHNYGLMHANFWDATTNYSSFGPGTNSEYGNIYDTMGLAGGGIYQYDAPHKNQLDWLKADAIQTVTSNGVYRIYPFDVPASSRVPGRFYAAAVQKDSLRYYWLEFRQLFTWNPWTENGLLLNWGPWPESSAGTQLIDTTPGSPDANDSLSRDDAALVIGRTFNDNAAGVHITPLQRGSSGTDPWIECQVNLGTFPGNLPPVVNMQVDNTNVAVGALVHFYVTATDPNGDTLAYAWSFDDLTFSTNNLPWTAKAFSTSGDHVVRCVVSDMKGGEASANVVVTVGGSGGFRVTGRVTDTNGVPLEGVLVSNGTTDPTQFIGGWTDSDGRYVLVNTGSTNFNLNAYQFGYTFAPVTTWSNPLQPTNDTPGIDFVGMPLPTVSISVDTNRVAESDSTAHHFTITRTGDTNNDLSVYIVSSGTATYNVNYTLSTDLTTANLITIPAGSYSVTLVFNALDTEGLGNTTVTLTLLDDLNYSSPGYALAPSAEAGITIFDDDAPAQPTVTVAAVTPWISENGIDTGEFVFTRIGSTQSALMVNYSVGGTAVPGTDFAPLAGSVIIPAGQSSATVFVQALDDHSVEPNATVTATLLSSASYTLGTQASDTITILDDGLSTVTVFPTLEPAAEPSSPGIFTIKRDGDLTYALVVNYSVGGTAVAGTDYVALSGSVTIPAGAASAQVSFTPLDDGLLAPDKYVTLVLTNDYNYDVGTPGSASVYITESERPTVSIAVTGTNFISEQGNSFGEFTISRTTTSGDLTVYLAISGSAAPGWNYLPLDNPVTIPNGSSSVTLDLIPFQDAILDPTLTVQLEVLSNTNYNVGSHNLATINILDDGTSQTPSVGFYFTTSQYLENQTPSIAVGLSVTSSMPVSVDYEVIGGTAPSSRYSLPAGTLLITNGLVGVIPLVINNDTTVEPPQTVQIVLYNPTNATLGAIRVHTCTILDDDLGSISVAATASNASEAGPVPGNFRITRVGPTTASQVVNFQITGTASAGADYASLGTAATIPGGASYVDLPVIPVQDSAPRLPQTVVLELISATNCAIVSPNIATVTISDTNTNPLPVITVTSTNQPYAVAGGVNGAFVFTRTGSTTSALTIDFTIGGTAPASRFVALPNSVTIPAGQTSVSLPVVAVDDHVVRGDQTVTVTLLEAESYHPAYPSSAMVTVQDSDQSVWIDASIFDASKYGPVPGQFTFSRFGTTNGPVTVFYAISGTASNGVDYVLITNSIVIPAGQTTVTLPILPLHTGVVTGPTTVTLTLATSSAYALGTRTSGTVTIDDDMPGLTISTIVSPVLEGSGSNGVFRVTRSGDPKYDFTAYLAAGGTAVYGVDYPPFPTNIYFNCGVTSIDLFVTASTNNLIVDSDQTVTATLLPNPAYTILWPSNALITITDAGTNQTPLVIITNPPTYVAFLEGTNSGLVLGATIIDAVPTNDVLTWSEVSGPPGCVFGDTNAANTTVLFTNTGVYLLQLTAANAVFQGSAEVLVFVSDDVLSETNILHWALDDGTGTNVADSSPYGRNGEFSGGSPAWITNGAIGGALQFFGTNDCVRQSAGSNTLNGLNAFTVALWVKPADLLDHGFLTGDDADTNTTFSLVTRQFASCGNDTNVVEATFATTAGVAHRVSASNALIPGQWQHLAITWTNGGAPQLYINGQLDQPSANFVAISGVLTNCPQFIIGKGSLDSPASWNGALDDVRVFNVALSPDEILALADGPVTNHAPVVNAGTNVTVQIGEPVTLVGTVTDDGLPKPPGVTTFIWTYLGTNNVTIPDPTSLTNTFTFYTPGDYTFQLTAFDGQLYGFAQVTVTVIPPTEVDITADISTAYDMGPVDGDFTITQTGTNAITVYLAISGSASNSVDYVTITNVVTIPDGSNSVSFPVLPLLNYRIKGDQSVIVTILTNLAYSIGNGQATVTIYDSPYGYWSITNFTLEELTEPQISGAGADASGDGIVNFAKYAFNLNPWAVNPNPPYTWDFETDTNDNLLHFTLTYTRILPPRVVQYGVYMSTDLLNWYTGTNYVEDFYETNDPNGFTETVKTRALMPFPSTTNLFMNIRVWLEQVPQ